jgi:hypothetical protein
MRKYFLLTLIFLGCCIYAFVRYHIGKGIAMDEFIFIFNKAVAWSALIFAALSILPEKKLNRLFIKRKTLGLSAYFFAIFHIFLNLFLINQSRFPKFYIGLNNYNPMFYLVLLTGLLSILVFTVVALVSLSIIKVENKNKFLKLGFYGVLINSLHPLFLGFQNWFKPLTWPFYMPPITLLVFVFVLLCVVLRYVWKENN